MRTHLSKLLDVPIHYENIWSYASLKLEGTYMFVNDTLTIVGGFDEDYMIIHDNDCQPVKLDSEDIESIRIFLPEPGWYTLISSGNEVFVSKTAKIQYRVSMNPDTHHIRVNGYNRGLPFEIVKDVDWNSHKLFTDTHEYIRRKTWT